MAMQKLKLNFARFTDSDLLTKAQQILQDMTGNPFFVNPIPTIADFELGINAYSVALVKAKDLGRLFVAEKNERRKALELLLEELGSYVIFVAKGSEVVLVSSGFDLTKPREASTITNPGAVSLSNGETSGQLNAQVQSQPGAMGYSFEYALYPLTAASVWTGHPSSRSKNTFSGLVAGKSYAVRVGVFGNNKEVLYSPVANMFVQ